MVLSDGSTLSVVILMWLCEEASGVCLHGPLDRTHLLIVCFFFLKNIRGLNFPSNYYIKGNVTIVIYYS